MGHHFLLVEGVNLYANIYDTDQLSVIRGSSFLYKDAIEFIQDQFAECLEPVSTGASSGLFHLKPDTAESIEMVAQKVRRCLREHGQYRHLTFGVECCYADHVQDAKCQLWGQLHFHQLQSLIRMPDVFSERHPNLNKPSGLEGIRIAAKDAARRVQSDTVRDLSLSELVRLKHGRNKKHEHEEFKFARDINALCAHPDKNYRLNGKMAVIYMDGNGFGRRQDDYLQQAIDKGEDGIQAQKDFDEKIQACRNEFLEDILSLMQSGEMPEATYKEDESDEDTEAGNVIRLETLLWGGDEMLFVVPAWLGMDFLQRFFECSRTWTLADGKAELTHAAGIVFCQAKTPIRIIQQLAKDLADRVKEAKDAEGNDVGRTRDSWDYLVLESIDYPTNPDLACYFTARYPTLSKRPESAIATTHWNQAKTALHALLNEGDLPIRQVYRILEAFHKAPPSGELTWNELFELNKKSEQERHKLEEKLSKQEKAEFQLIRTLKSDPRESVQTKLRYLADEFFDLNIDKAEQRAWLWLHLRELWDYLLPTQGESK